MPHPQPYKTGPLQKPPPTFVDFRNSRLTSCRLPLLTLVGVSKRGSRNLNRRDWPPYWHHGLRGRQYGASAKDDEATQTQDSPSAPRPGTVEKRSVEFARGTQFASILRPRNRRVYLLVTLLLDHRSPVSTTYWWAGIQHSTERRRLDQRRQHLPARPCLERMTAACAVWC